MEGPILPEESEGEEPSAEALLVAEERALQQYEARMRAFEDALCYLGPKRKRRKAYGQWKAKNCEESWGNRDGQGAKAGHGVG